jgi:hypothetical protein
MLVLELWRTEADLKGARAIFLPIMVVTLPLPHRSPNTSGADGLIPAVVRLLVLRWTIDGTLALCVYQLVTNSLGRTKRITDILDEDTAPSGYRYAGVQGRTRGFAEGH